MQDQPIIIRDDEDLPEQCEKEDDSKRQMSKRYLITWNNPKELIHNLDLIWSESEMTFLTGQREQAPTTGMIHYHFYLVWKDRKSFKFVKKWFSQQPHKLEPPPNILICRGDEEKNIIYVNKPETRTEGPWTKGTADPNRGKQGQRNDLLDIHQMIQHGASLPQIAIQHPEDYLRYHSGIDRMFILLAPEPPTRRDVHVITLFGTTGLGKTHRARTQYPDAYIAHHGRDPFCMYTNQKVLILDDFNPGQWDLEEMKNILDVWSLQLNVRYQNKWARWTLVIITTNYNPINHYMCHPTEDVDPYRRRIGLMAGGDAEIVNVLSKDQIVDLKWPKVVQPSNAQFALVPQSLQPHATTPVLTADSTAPHSPPCLTSPTASPPLMRRKLSRTESVNLRNLRIPETQAVIPPLDLNQAPQNYDTNGSPIIDD